MASKIKGKFADWHWRGNPTTGITFTRKAAPYETYGASPGQTAFLFDEDGYYDWNGSGLTPRQSGGGTAAPSAPDLSALKAATGDLRAAFARYDAEARKLGL